jgi:hypothetical protein
MLSIQYILDLESMFKKGEEKVSYIGDASLFKIMTHMIIDRLMQGHDNPDVLVTNLSIKDAQEQFDKVIAIMPNDIKDLVEYKGALNYKIGTYRLRILSIKGDYVPGLRGCGTRNVVLHNFSEYGDEYIDEFKSSILPAITCSMFSKVIISGKENVIDCEVIDV